MLIVVKMGKWSDDSACGGVHDVRLNSVLGKSMHTTENEGITFTVRPHTSPKLIANNVNRQFTTSKLGKHSSSRTRQVSNDVKRMSLE